METEQELPSAAHAVPRDPGYAKGLFIPPPPPQYSEFIGQRAPPANPCYIGARSEGLGLLHPLDSRLRLCICGPKRPAATPLALHVVHVSGAL